MQESEKTHNNNEIEEKTNSLQKCGICGDPHFYKNCKYVRITSKIPDQIVPTRARLSLPKNLEIKKLADESYAVFSKSPIIISVGTEFGPFIATKSLTLHPSTIFPIKIFLNDNSVDSDYYLEAIDENNCCWMMFVKPAENAEEQNLICYQIDENVFFAVIRNIKCGEELKVWYSPYSAYQMQKTILKFKKPLRKTELEQEEVDKLNVLIKEQQNIIPRLIWNCKFCFKLEKNVTDFANHLLTHYIVQTKKILCQFCEKRFRFIKAYKKHIQLYHKDCDNSLKNLKEVSLKIIDFSKKKAQIEKKRNAIRDPLLLQCLNDSLDNSNSLLSQCKSNSSLNHFNDIENYENPILFEEHLCLNIDVLDDPLEMNGREQENDEFVCDICLKKFPSRKSISTHLLLHSGKYFCRSCKKIFGRRENLQRHKCNTIYSIKCLKCSKIFFQRKYLERHILIFHDKKYRCKLCKRIFYSSNEVKYHCCMKVPKEERIQIKCTNCNKYYYSQRGLRNHVKMKHTAHHHERVKLICTQCPETFSCNRTLQRHLKTVHNNLRRYECKICDKKFKRADVLKQHISNVHHHGPFKEEEKSECSICKKQFKLKRYLDVHLKSAHSTEKFPCKICSLEYSYSRSLLRHMKTVHNVERKRDESYECSICKVRVKLKNSLQRHIKMKHPADVSHQISVKLNDAKKEMYKCLFCSYKVKLKTTLQRHISNKHPGERKLQEKRENNKWFDDDVEEYMDLQKTIENMDFSANDNLFSGSETIDRFLKESSDQIQILPIENIKMNFQQRNNNIEAGFSMPDLSEVEQDVKTLCLYHWG